MMSIETIAFLSSLILGAFAGLIAGLLGVGGGLVIVPGLILLLSLLDVQPSFITHLSIGTSLATIVVTSLSSIRAHHKLRGVNWHWVAMLSPGLLVGAFLGAVTASQLSSERLQWVFGVIMVLLSVKLLTANPQPGHSKRITWMNSLVPSVFIGWVSSLAGIGGGSLSVPYLLYRGSELIKAIGTAAACGLPLSLAGAVSFIATGGFAEDLPVGSFGYVYIPAFFGIVLTSVMTAPIGAKLAHQLPAKKLKRIFAAFLIVVGVKILVS